MSKPRRPLLFIVTTDDAERLRGALTIACATAALGGAARLFLQLDAVALLRPPLTAPRDSAHMAHGLPGLAALLDDALALGVEVTVCQSGLALAALDAELLDPRIDVGGPVGVLAGHDAGEELVVL